MRTLIDGYNLMHAAGLMKSKFGPRGLRHARHRFLDRLAASLDPNDALQTTVVFDARDPPTNLPAESSHKGISIIFAVGDENADARLEWLIAHHSAPKSLTVVSTDHRVRQVASARRAQAVTADEFWSRLADRRSRKPPRPPPPPQPAESDRERGLSAAEAAFWANEFRDLDQEPTLRQEHREQGFVPTDDEIKRIEREVREEE